jgi:putative FmdB family regulatory protein
MPQYNYKCKDCQSDFLIICGINDSRENIRCTNCGSLNIARIFNAKILKGKRAKGYKDEAEEISKTGEPLEKNSTKEHSHENGQCSPELDYQ